MFLLNERVQGVTPELLDLYEKVCPSTIGHMTDFGFIMHVQRLRRKLGWENNLVAVYKVGYRLEVVQ